MTTARLRSERPNPFAAKSEGCGLRLAALVGLLVLWLPLAALRGWVLSVLWAWFVVPVFGLPGLSVPYAMGIAMLVGLLTSHPQPKTSRNEQLAEAMRQILFAVGVPLLALGLGYLVHLFT